MANPAKPIKEHKDKGNYRPSRHDNRIDGKLKVLGAIPKPPEHYDKRHANLWQTCCKELFELGVLANPDVRMIEMYVSHFFLWQDAIKSVQEEGYSVIEESNGKISTTRNPAISVMNESCKIVNQIADKFGFSPRARMGIKTDPQEPEDPFARFLNN